MATRTKNMYIAIDFDGTIVEHEYPDIGGRNPGALETMRDLIAQGHKLILFTMRSGYPLQDAVKYLKANGIELYGINENPDQQSWTRSPKAYANLYIDDAALGCPLRDSLKGLDRQMVDWKEVEAMLRSRGILE